MRTICGLLGLAAAGFLAASAHGLNVPTVSTPTVTVPSVSVPAPSLPKPTLPKPTLPTPTVPAPTPTTAPVPVPVPPAPKPTVPATTVAAPAPATPTTSAPRGSSPAGASPAAAPAASSSAAPPASSAPAGRYGTAPSRSYGVAGTSHTSRQRRAASLFPPVRRVIARFTLAHPGRIRISIEQLAPVCRTLRSYLVRLPKGTHAFRFPATRVTEVGTYQVTATLRDHKLFSVRARRLHKRVKLGGSANVCTQLPTRTAYSLSTAGTLGANGFSPSAAGTSGGKDQLHVKAAHGGRRSAAPATSRASAPEKNPLVRAVSLTDAPRSLQPLLFTLLAIAIVLLALAAAPQHVLPAGRAAAIVATRRAYFAAAGIWLLVVVAIVTAFS